jgi:UDP-N-acetyl-D-mannosaminuronate dehydrogenase
VKKKIIVAGLGEIGKPILQLLSKSNQVIGYDINQKLMDLKKFNKYENLPTSFLHICIPFSKNFIPKVLDLSKKFQPQIIVIHSTISPNTTKFLQEKLPIPVIYSATRGVHKRMLLDLKRYTKFFAIDNTAPKAEWAAQKYSKLLKKSGVKSKQMSNPLTLELAKIVVDTSYYGWLINFAQLSNLIAIKNKVDYDEMWSFADEIHKFLGNRPKMFPGYIGGHCVIPNLDLIHHTTLELIRTMNNNYIKQIPNAKTIQKKYNKSKKQSYDE